MIKRLFSKRSGFTLVEIIVAFAVFAIMSTMIIQVLNMISLQRRSNNEFAREVDEQDGYLVTHDKLGYDDAKANDGTLHFEFSDGTKLDVDYQMNGTSPTGEVDGLAYFVSKEGELADDYDGDSDDPGDYDDSNNTGAQTDRVDARITGTRGFDYISVDKVIKVDEYTDENGRTITVYAFELSANAGSSMNTNDIPYANYRLYFYNKSGNAAQIVSANYINASFNTADDWKNLGSGAKKAIGSDTGAVSSSPDATNNKYTVSITSTNGIRVGSPFKAGAGNSGSSSKYRCSQCGTIYNNDWEAWGNCANATSSWDPCYYHLSTYVEPTDPDAEYTGNGVKFTSGNKTRIEISFYGDPELTVASFGSNGVANGSSYRYSANANIGGVEAGPNIYGAYPK